MYTTHTRRADTRQNWKIYKMLVICLGFVLFVLPSDVYSHPDNDIELPSKHGISNDGVVGKSESHNVVFYKNHNGMKSLKPHMNRKGKHHRRSFKSRARKFLDPKTVYFDYYPVEHVEFNYDPHEDDNIKVTLISDHQDNVEQIPNSRSSKRSKRDVQPSEIAHMENESNGKSKREGRYAYPKPNEPFYEREYYTHAIPAHSSPNTHKFIKYAIRGNYYNPITPTGNAVPFQYLQYLAGINNNNNNNNEGGINFGNRIDQSEGIDERLIWGRRPDPNYKPNISNNNNQIDNSVRPTRPAGHRRPTTAPTKKNTSPPLIHMRLPSPGNSDRVSAKLPFSLADRFQPDMDAYDNDGPVWSRNPNRANPNEQSASPPRTSPPLVHTTSKPEESPPKEEGPSKCVWAIVTCCSKNNLKVRYSCFEELGCYGAFWDINPCAEQYQRRAIAEADRYFE